jgi:hypothetical protein
MKRRCLPSVAGTMALYNNTVTSYYDFLFIELAGE